jgi:hypothetical protein
VHGSGERLIRTGVLTPFDRLDGFERRVKMLKASETSNAAIASAQAGAYTRLLFCSTSVLSVG